MRIAADLARSYYLEVDLNDQPTALCLIPGRALPGETIEPIERQFNLTISEPVEFPLLVSSVRLADEPGELIPIDEEQMRRLPPIRTAIRTERKTEKGTVPVRLHSRLNEIGTIEMWCHQIDRDRRWRLQFDVRAATETDRVATESTGEQEGTFDESSWEPCRAHIHTVFSADGSGKPGMLVKQLSESTGMERDEWPMPFLRRIWETLMEYQEGRRNSQAHEARWLNLVGYSLRPGYGMAVDDWRVTETWRLVQGKLAFRSAACTNAVWILWRRIAGGLPSGQQRALAEPLLSSIRALHGRMVEGKSRGEFNFSIPDTAELWRLIGALELLPVRTKRDAGRMMLDLFSKRKAEPIRPAIVWAVGRLGAREPVYGPLNTVLDPAVAQAWTEQLIKTDLQDPVLEFAVLQLTRKTGDRYRDVSDATRKLAIEWLRSKDASAHVIELIAQGGTLDHEQQSRAFGDSPAPRLADTMMKT